MTLNEAGKIIADKALRFFRQPIATATGDVIAEVVVLRGERFEVSY